MTDYGDRDAGAGRLLHGERAQWDDLYRCDVEPAQRVFQHREGLVPGFTGRYGCKLLVWYERYETMPDAIAREKQIKGGSRAKKLVLIEAMNPRWRDLYEDLA